MFTPRPLFLRAGWNSGAMGLNPCSNICEGKLGIAMTAGFGGTGTGGTGTDSGVGVTA